MRIGIMGVLALGMVIATSSPSAGQTGLGERLLGAAGERTRDGDFGGPQVSDSGVGYIDNAILGDQLRFRFDAAYNNVEPARAEFFWPVDAAFGPGPGPERRVDYQDLSLYAERRFAYQWSAFGEMTVEQWYEDVFRFEYRRAF